MEGSRGGNPSLPCPASRDATIASPQLPNGNSEKNMDVTIQERSMSFVFKYDIDTPRGRWYARQEFLELFNVIDLSESEDGPAIAKLKSQFSPLHHRWEFDLADGRTVQFECVDLLRQVYECRYGSDVLTLYRHHGLNHSIFSGERQIAAYSKNRVSFGDGNEYQIRMDSDADMTLIVCMVLALSVTKDNDEKKAVNIDIGSLGPQGRAFDEAWEPR